MTLSRIPAASRMEWAGAIGKLKSPFSRSNSAIGRYICSVRGIGAVNTTCLPTPAGLSQRAPVLGAASGGLQLESGSTNCLDCPQPPERGRHAEERSSTLHRCHAIAPPLIARTSQVRRKTPAAPMLAQISLFPICASPWRSGPPPLNGIRSDRPSPRLPHPSIYSLAEWVIANSSRIETARASYARRRAAE